MKRLRWITVLCVVGCLLIVTGTVRAAYVYNTSWNPPNIVIDSSHPYYFPLNLPGWDFNKGDYTKAMFELTYLDQWYLDINVFAADPATDTSNASSYNILIGTVPCTIDGASGTAQFNLLAMLNDATFDALFDGQNTLYLVADCHYVFDKAALSLEANPIPIPPAFLLLGSGLLGLLGFRRGLNRP